MFPSTQGKAGKPPPLPVNLLVQTLGQEALIPQATLQPPVPASRQAAIAHTTKRGSRESSALAAREPGVGGGAGGGSRPGRPPRPAPLLSVIGPAQISFTALPTLLQSSSSQCRLLFPLLQGLGQTITLGTHTSYRQITSILKCPASAKVRRWCL